MIFLAITCLASLALAAYVLRQRDKEAADWQAERQLLITRIQHPEIILPPSPDEEFVDDSQFMTAEQDDIDMVGTIQTGAKRNGD